MGRKERKGEIKKGAKSCWLVRRERAGVCVKDGTNTLSVKWEWGGGEDIL